MDLRSWSDSVESISCVFRTVEFDDLESGSIIVIVHPAGFNRNSCKTLTVLHSNSCRSVSLVESPYLPSAGAAGVVVIHEKRKYSGSYGVAKPSYFDARWKAYDVQLAVCGF